MRIKDSSATSLIDLSPLQAHRLGNTHFERALAAGRFDPFPDGTQAVGDRVQRGSLAQNSGTTEAAIAGGALSGFDGAMPDHIQAALQRSLHKDDESLRAFLAVFDRRLLELRVRAEKAQILVATQDARGSEAATLLDRLVRLVRCKGKDKGKDMRYLRLILPLLSRVRSLEGLRNLVSWWSGRSVRVACAFDTMHPIDASCMTRLSRDAHHGARLGQGAVLGRFGKTPTGRLSVFISCNSREDFGELSRDIESVAELRNALQKYLRDPVPVTFYADVERRLVEPPKISSKPRQADRLGAYNLLSPQAAPEDRAFLKLSDIAA
ncbi:MAG: type VI secretion system baseplate subunit TssG [Pseudomonadota bacterium]